LVEAAEGWDSNQTTACSGSGITVIVIGTA
jgi:hypothetical protein